MKTSITELLNIKYPIFQGGMAWVADGDLAGAVSNAGGLGIIGGGNAPKEVVKANIDKVKAITDKPFGVNIMLLSPFADDIVDLVIEEGVKVVTTGAGNPGRYMERLHAAGIIVIPHNSGSPPRMRVKPHTFCQTCYSCRITPAHAGKTCRVT